MVHGHSGNWIWISNRDTMTSWKEIKSKTWSFQFGEEPELIHVIETGFKDRYMVIHEDAYELDLGKVEFFNKVELESKFKIKLSNN